MNTPADSDKKNSNEAVVVGIGASAGGLDALQRILPGLPVKEGIAYVIAQHLAPRYRSMLDSLLTKHTRLKIEIIKDGTRVRPDTLYITPPSKDVKLAGGRLELSQAASIGPKPSIDLFFTSLAEEKGHNAVGIILSGTGTDGAHGIRAIKSNDGITIVQSLDTAKFDGMPRAAMETDCVDLVLPPEKIGHELESALKYPSLIAQEPEHDRHLDEIRMILSLLNKRLKVDFSDYKSSTIYRRISRRMVLHKLSTLYDYLKFVKANPDELDKLYKDLLISVTSFFRDTKAFEALTVALRKKLKEKHPGDSIRIWVPACATGEEAYSMSMLLFDILGDQIDKYRIQIFATDIDEDSIQFARKCTYPLATVMDTDNRRFERYFTHTDNTVSVNKPVRDLVVLARQDLLKNTPFLHLDLISCRNLLIYLNPELQNKILSLFHYSLDPGGLLFLGKSESVNQKTELFSAVHTKWKIYERRETLSHRMPQLVQRHQSHQLARMTGSPQSLEKTELWKEREFASSLLQVLDCSAVMTDAQGNILYIRGDVGDYLKLPEGSVKDTLNAVSMARQEFRYILQSLLHRASKEDRVLTSQEIKMEGQDGNRAVRLKVGQVKETAGQTYFLTIFDRIELPDPPLSPDESDSDRSDSRIAELEQELEVTREHLQDTLEELETSGEELQSLNEELQSANEELQASNEELETSNEELQASNEELNTVNQEMRVKSDELTATLSDLEASEQRYRLLVDNMNEALLVCELEHGPGSRPTDVMIQQVNAAMETMLSIDARDLPLRASIVGLPELAKKQMLTQLENISKGSRPNIFSTHFSRLEKDLLLSVYHLEAGRLGIICRDETQRKKFEADLKASQEAARRNLSELEAIYTSAPIGLCMIDKELKFLRINQTMADINGIPIPDHIGRHISEIVPDLADQVEDILETIRKTGEPVWDMEITGKTPAYPDMERTWIEQWMPITDRDGEIAAVNVVVQDITERKQMETLLANHGESLEKQVRKRTAELESTVKALELEAETRQQAEDEVKKLSRVFMDATDPIIIEDLEGLMTEVNYAAATAYGYAVDELTGTSVFRLVPEKQQAFERKLRRRCIDGEMVHDLEAVRQNRSGQTIPSLLTAFTIKDSTGQPEAIATIAKDMTRLKKLEAGMRRRSEELVRLTGQLTLSEQRERRRLAALLHDHIQQLLVGTKLRLETLQRKEGMAGGQKEITAALEMTAEAINASRSLATELSPTILHAKGLVSALRWLIRQMKSRHGFEVTLTADEHIEVKQESLNILLYESVRELLFNAVKHSGVTEASVFVTADESRLSIVVSDGGNGFDPSDLALDEKKHLSGFGLFNIRERIQLLGGRFEIDSAPEKGTRISLTSPLATEHYSDENHHITPDAVPSPPVPEAVQPDSASGAKPGEEIRVMLADDHAVMRDALSNVLAQQPDIRMTAVASNGAQAVEMAVRDQPDVILMDISMPVMDGLAATRQITEAFPDIRVILLTMYEHEDMSREVSDSGAFAFFNKNGHFNDLMATIRNSGDK
ncbi:MAG TPA: hypothetical protein DHV36_18555 [Desulfobacteraceae bacterium]|nr:hypothetical protein [Desulfobacteraceae bacterium]